MTRRPVSVILDIENIDSDVLPDQLMRTSVSFAEPASGPHATDDPIERARRQDRLQRAEATFESLPFDHAAARVWDDLRSRPCRRKPRGGRAIDLLIAAVALSERLPLDTRNPADSRCPSMADDNYLGRAT